jgi:hypothetical protein
MEPLLARCRSCDARVCLAEIAERHDGRCPGCGVSFSAEWTNLLVEECEAIDQLANALIRSLRRLAGLPGNLELQSEQLMKNLIDEVPWGQSIDTEPTLVAEQIAALVRSLDQSPAPIDHTLVANVRTLTTKLLGLATVLDANQEATRPSRRGAGSAARDAAASLDEVADAIDRGESDAAELRKQLEAASRTT